MFFGVIQAEMRSILHEHVKGWDCAEIYVGCCGAFTIPDTIADLGFKIHGNDVTLFSAMVGAYISGQPAPIDGHIAPEHQEMYGWLEDWVGDPESALATALLSTNLLAGIGKESNPHYGRLYEAYVKQWPVLHAKTVAKVEAYATRLETYTSEDVVTWVDKIPKDGAFICYPPFFGAAKIYSGFYKKMHALFEWEEPPFTMLDNDLLIEFFGKVLEFKHGLFAANKRLPEYEDNLVSMTKPTNRAPSNFIYTSERTTKRIVQPRQSTQPLLAPRLAPGDDVGEVMSLVQLSHGQFSMLRSQYMNKGIRPGQETFSLGVLVDGKLIGVFAFGNPSSSANWTGAVTAPYIYLLSDFPVAPTSYPRLSKLVLYAALSKETKLLCERSQNHRVRSMVTTAFSKRPQSMKYRGLFRLLTRKENKARDEAYTDDLGDANSYYDQKFELNYGQELGRLTLAESLAEWKTKHGQKADGAVGASD